MLIKHIFSDTDWWRLEYCYVWWYWGIRWSFFRWCSGMRILHHPLHLW